MNLEQLQHLQVILNEGSISKAAQVLFTTQPALSRQLKMLEKEAGITIFERTTPLRLTYEGERYMQFVKMVLREQQVMKNDLIVMARQNKGNLTVGISRNREEQFLQYILPAFRRSYPGIRVNLKEDSAKVLEQRLMNREIDLICMSQKTDMPGIVFEPMLEEEIHLAVPKNYAPSYTEAGTLNFHDLEQVPFVLMKPGYRIRDIANQVFAKKGIHPNVIMETSSTTVAFWMAAEGMGATFVSTIPTRVIPAKEKPLLFSMTPEKYTWLLGCAYYQDSPNMQNIRLFSECVRNAIAQSPFYDLSLENKPRIL